MMPGAIRGAVGKQFIRCSEKDQRAAALPGGIAFAIHKNFSAADKLQSIVTLEIAAVCHTVALAATAVIFKGQIGEIIHFLHDPFRNIH